MATRSHQVLQKEMRADHQELSTQQAALLNRDQCWGAEKLHQHEFQRFSVYLVDFITWEEDWNGPQSG